MVPGVAAKRSASSASSDKGTNDFAVDLNHLAAHAHESEAHELVKYGSGMHVGRYLASERLRRAPLPDARQRARFAGRIAIAGRSEPARDT